MKAMRVYMQIHACLFPRPIKGENRQSLLFITAQAYKFMSLNNSEA